MLFTLDLLIHKNDMKSLPPLNALRAFETAARHLSFSKGAEELNVTPGAISQQIKLLEDYLDIRLFIRLNRQIVLTEAGQILLPKLVQAFKTMTEAVESVHSYDKNEPLTISAPPSFVAKWLIPRLNLFNKIHPEIDVRIDSSTRLVDFEHENIDIGIRFSQQKDPALDSTHLMSLEVIPVCSPELVTQGRGLRKPADLKHQTLLHYEVGKDEQSWPDWTMWLATMQIDNIDTSRGISFNQPDMLIQAAIESQGIALVATVFTEKDIQQGRLVRAFDLTMPIRFSYYLVTSLHKARRKKVLAFKKWIMKECGSKEIQG